MATVQALSEISHVTCVMVMVVAKLPAGAGVHMEKSHWREYCPSVGLSQVIWREGEG